MTITWYKSQSTIRPTEVDYTSSPTTVYLHRKIKQVGEYYEYEESKLTPAEYTVYAAEQTRQDSLAIMSALVDIYDAIGGEE